MGKGFWQEEKRMQGERDRDTVEWAGGCAEGASEPGSCIRQYCSMVVVSGWSQFMSSSVFLNRVGARIVPSLLSLAVTTLGVTQQLRDCVQFLVLC